MRSASAPGATNAQASGLAQDLGVQPASLITTHRGVSGHGESDEKLLGLIGMKLAEQIGSEAQLERRPDRRDLNALQTGAQNSFRVSLGLKAGNLARGASRRITS